MHFPSIGRLQMSHFCSGTARSWHASQKHLPSTKKYAPSIDASQALQRKQAAWKTCSSTLTISPEAGLLQPQHFGTQSWQRYLLMLGSMYLGLPSSIFALHCPHCCTPRLETLSPPFLEDLSFPSPSPPAADAVGGGGGGGGVSAGVTWLEQVCCGGFDRAATSPAASALAVCPAGPPRSACPPQVRRLRPLEGCLTMASAEKTCFEPRRAAAAAGRWLADICCCAPRAAGGTASEGAGAGAAAADDGWCCCRPGLLGCPRLVSLGGCRALGLADLIAPGDCRIAPSAGDRLELDEGCRTKASAEKTLGCLVSPPDVGGRAASRDGAGCSAEGCLPVPLAAEGVVAVAGEAAPLPDSAQRSTRSLPRLLLSPRSPRSLPP
mmetsp:Transcript_138381/g.345328  ORF Transcript_138381/g.345328 Transcript_138381/m.345328 type:complete len:380 (+) Transcript_138381:1600-2739(+)